MKKNNYKLHFHLLMEHNGKDALPILLYCVIQIFEPFNSKQSKNVDKKIMRMKLTNLFH